MEEKNTERNRSQGFVKLFRSFTKWEWYTDGSTMRLFLHCLLMANYQDKEWRGITVKRGEFVSSLSKISEETGLSIQNIRTALKHLEVTHELTCSKSAKYTLFKVNNYDLYQQGNTLTNTPLTRSNHATQHAEPENLTHNLTQSNDLNYALDKADSDTSNEQANTLSNTLNPKNQHATNTESNTHNKNKEIKEIKNTSSPSFPPLRVGEGEKKKKGKLSWGPLGNVKLTQREYDLLVEDFGEDEVTEAIMNFGKVMKQNGKTYKHHSLCIRKRIKGEVPMPKPKQTAGAVKEIPPLPDWYSNTAPEPPSEEKLAAALARQAKRREQEKNVEPSMDCEDSNSAN